MDYTVTTLSRLWGEHFGKAASIGRQMTENTVQNGALYPLGNAQPFCSKCNSYV